MKHSLKTFGTLLAFFIALAGAYGLGGWPALMLAFGALVFIGVAVEDLRSAIARAPGSSPA